MISVVIPVYNRTLELSRAIESVLSQTYQKFEIIVVDDCSDNDIKGVVDGFIDKRIIYYRLEKKGNGNVCRNLGVKSSRGEYIAMLDSDDEWLPDHLEKRIDFFIKNNVDGTFGSIIINDGQKLKKVSSRPFADNENMANYLLLGGLAQTSTHFYKANCAKEILWDETLFRNQDLDYSIRFAERYEFVPVIFFTCIVHWRRGEARNEHFESNIKFIEKHKHKLSAQAYHKFYANMYMRVYNRADVNAFYKKYFLQHSTKYISFCSLADFMMTHGVGKSFVVRFLQRFVFAFKVIFSSKQN